MPLFSRLTDIFGMAALDNIDPAPDVFAHEIPQSVGCAFGSRIEDDDIPLVDAVRACHEVARKIEAMGE